MYALLLSTAALPCWLCARPAAPWRLEPMGMAQAAGLIRSTLQSYLARRRREVSDERERQDGRGGAGRDGVHVASAARLSQGLGVSQGLGFAK